MTAQVTPTKVSTQPKVSVVVVSFNTRDILKKCLDQLYQAAEGLAIEVIVVDNHSRDASADMVAEQFPDAVLVRSDLNLGFAAANNVAFKQARGEYILLLNPDAMVEADALRLAIDHMDRNPAIGIGGGRLIDRDGNWQPSARMFPSLLNECLVLSGLANRYPKSRFFGRFDRTWDTSDRPVVVDWVPGAFTMIRRSALESVGHFDERFFLYYEEVDLCRRFNEHGWQIWYWPDITVKHWGGESSKTVKQEDFNSSGSQLTLWRMRSGAMYYRKHHGWFTAKLVTQIESIWHQLRAWRAQGRGNAQRVSESKRMVELWHKAWHETSGGQVSPPRPW